uniref:Uncharacterized protein n=1 Tax=Cucumis melo TaxID=3656 RepID=A0A9I9EFS1_CUCME
MAEVPCGHPNLPPTIILLREQPNLPSVLLPRAVIILPMVGFLHPAQPQFLFYPQFEPRAPSPNFSSAHAVRLPSTVCLTATVCRRPTIPLPLNLLTTHTLQSVLPQSIGAMKPYLRQFIDV